MPFSLESLLFEVKMRKTQSNDSKSELNGFLTALVDMLKSVVPKRRAKNFKAY
jgi:hypothetical protein